MYTVFFLYLAGVSLITLNWIALGWFAITASMILTRIQHEERAMLKEFGRDYYNYMQKTGALFPSNAGNVGLPLDEAKRLSELKKP